MRPLPRRLQAPPGLAAAFAGRTLALVHQLLDDTRAGRRWIARWEWGVVKAVDPAARRATVDLGTGRLVDVSYGRDPPAVGDWQAVYVPNVGTPWIKTQRASGFIRWLYYRVLLPATGGAPAWAIYRARWPLDATRAPQRVRSALVPAWRALTGFHVPGRCLVECRPAWMRHGGTAGATPDEATTLTTYGDWGFGAARVQATGRYTGWITPAPDLAADAPAAFWLSTWEAVSTLVTWDVPPFLHTTPVDTRLNLLLSRDGGARWDVLESLEAKRPILDPASGANASPANYPTIHAVTPVLGSAGPSVWYPIYTLANPPATTDDHPAPLSTLHLKRYAAGHYTDTGVDGPAPVIVGAPWQGGGVAALGEQGDRLQLYALLDTDPPFFGPFGWAAHTGLWGGTGDARGLAWGALGLDLAPIVSPDGQALIGYPRAREATRVVSDDGGATFTPAPAPWDDPDGLIHDLLFVDIPADDPLALEAAK